MMLFISFQFRLDTIFRGERNSETHQCVLIEIKLSVELNLLWILMIVNVFFSQESNCSDSKLRWLSADKRLIIHYVVFLYRSETPKKLPITSQSSPSNKTVLKPLYYPLSGWRWFDGSGSLAPVSVPAQSGSCFEARSEWYSGSDNRLM